MWHLYYNSLGEITHLNKKKLDLDLEFIKIKDDLALDFLSGELQYVRFVVNDKKLKLKTDNRTATWAQQKFVSPVLLDPDIVFSIQDGYLVYTAKPNIPNLGIWITEKGNPLRLIARMEIPKDTRLLLDTDVKISIFADKNYPSFALNYD